MSARMAVAADGEPYGPDTGEVLQGAEGTATAMDGEILAPEIKIDLYQPHRAKLFELREMNAKLVFDYEDKQGNKEARSYVKKLRETKASIDRARKAIGQAALEYKRRVDAEGNDIIAEFEVMIEAHAKPLKEIEQREKDRLEAIQARVDALRSCVYPADVPVAELIAQAARVKAVAIDDSFAELIAQAAIAKDEALTSLEAQLVAARQRDADKAELERLRAEAAETERLRREEQIRKDAAAQAENEAARKLEAEKQAGERRAQEERDAAARREFELRRTAEKAEQDRIAAERRADEAAATERQRIAGEQAALAAEEQRRQADLEHRKTIHAGIIEALAVVGVSEDMAKAIIIAIRKGKVPNVAIAY